METSDTADPNGQPCLPSMEAKDGPQLGYICYPCPVAIPATGQTFNQCSLCLHNAPPGQKDCCGASRYEYIYRSSGVKAAFLAGVSWQPQGQVAISCIHGDTATYPTVKVRGEPMHPAPRGGEPVHPAPKRGGAHASSARGGGNGPSPGRGGPQVQNPGLQQQRKDACCSHLSQQRENACWFGPHRQRERAARAASASATSTSRSRTAGAASASTARSRTAGAASAAPTRADYGLQLSLFGEGFRMEIECGEEVIVKHREITIAKHAG
ncbi:UNVERIFIED_CONTAM: hypothetical protein FKN15_002646 [Acipenser sinensis]